MNSILEAFTIRLAWIAWALELRAKPGLCPPECREGHTYLWPCRARIKKPKKSTIGAYHDRLGPMPESYGPPTETQEHRIDGYHDKNTPYLNLEGMTFEGVSEEEWKEANREVRKMLREEFDRKIEEAEEDA